MRSIHGRFAPSVDRKLAGDNVLIFDADVATEVPNFGVRYEASDGSNPDRTIVDYSGLYLITMSAVLRYPDPSPNTAFNARLHLTRGTRFTYQMTIRDWMFVMPVMPKMATARYSLHASAVLALEAGAWFTFQAESATDFFVQTDYGYPGSLLEVVRISNVFVPPNRIQIGI
jgi:hypothetical protein